MRGPPWSTYSQKTSNIVPHITLSISNTLAMVPAPMAPAPEPTQVIPTGPHPSFIQVAKPYMFQQHVNTKLMIIGANPTREDQFRLQGVTWINDVRVALQLSVLP